MNDLDGTEQPYNPVREGRQHLSAVPPALCGEQKSGCRDGVPAGGLGAKPLRFSVVKNTFLQ